MALRVAGVLAARRTLSSGDGAFLGYVGRCALSSVMFVKLAGWGLRPWMEFDFDPANGRYVKRRLKSDPTVLDGYAGFGQELRIRDVGIALCSVFVHQQDVVLRVGTLAWSLFEAGLELTHQPGAWHCQLSVKDRHGTEATFRYRRKDLLQEILDPTYNDLDFELANLPANLPSLARRDRAELVAEWSARAARRQPPGSSAR